MAQAAESYLSEIQKVAGEDGLQDAEIARLLKSVQAAQFKRSEVIPAEADSSFKPRSLVEIAFEAEKKRQEDAARQLAVEKAAKLAAQQAEQAAENADPNQTVTPAEPAQQNPDMGPAASTPAAAAEAGAMAPPASQPAADAEARQQVSSQQSSSQQALLQQQQAEQEAAAAQARQQREAEDANLRAQAEEDGYRRGFEAGLEAARSAEPTDEEKAHAAAKEQERADIINRLEAVIAATASAEAVDVSELAPVLEQAVLRLASERAGVAIQDNPQGLVQRIENLVEKVKSGAQAISVTLNPDDLKAVETWRPATSNHPQWMWRSDASLACGDIQLKLDGITVTDLLGADTEFRPAEIAEPVSSAPQPSVEMQVGPEAIQAEIQAEGSEEPFSEPPLAEANISEEMSPEAVLAEEQVANEQLAEEQGAKEQGVAQSADAMGGGDAETEAGEEAGTNSVDEDAPAS